MPTAIDDSKKTINVIPIQICFSIINLDQQLEETQESKYDLVKKS